MVAGAFRHVSKRHSDQACILPSAVLDMQHFWQAAIYASGELQIKAAALQRPPAMCHTFRHTVDDDVNNTTCWDTADVRLYGCNVFQAADSKGGGLHRHIERCLQCQNVGQLAVH